MPPLALSPVTHLPHLHSPMLETETHPHLGMNWSEIVQPGRNRAKRRTKSPNTQVWTTHHLKTGPGGQMSCGPHSLLARESLAGTGTLALEE